MEATKERVVCMGKIYNETYNNRSSIVFADLGVTPHIESVISHSAHSDMINFLCFIINIGTEQVPEIHWTPEPGSTSHRS